MRIPLNDLQRQTRALQPELEAAVARVMARGWYVLGPELEAFEAEFEAYLGSCHAVGVANGTDALELALRALEIAPGDRVATVANAGMYSTAAILAIGAEPVYVDIAPATFNMDPRQVPSDVRAIIATHLYGRMADMPAILEAAGEIPVIEDCAQAHGAERDRQRAGTWGTLGCFSFYPTKNLGALGDAGAVVTKDVHLRDRLRNLRQYGWTSKYHATVRSGRNSRLDEMQAAVLRAKLPHLDAWNDRRRAIAAAYTGAPQTRDYVAHLCVVRSTRRAEIRQQLAAAGIATDIHYPVPDYRQPAVNRRTYLPETERACAEVITLPCFPELTDEEIATVAAETRRAMAESD